jgi:type IV fimbrial biogenesis protein FimT
MSLIELAIGLAIMGLLIALGVPSYQQWIQNSQIRSAAQTLLQGLQMARSNAVRRNEFVSFNLTGSGGTPDWRVGCATATAACPSNIQSWTNAEGAANVRIGTSTANGAFGTALGAGAGVPGAITFNGTGRVVTAPGVAPIARIDVMNPSLAVADQRRLVVLVTAGGAMRLCDPKLVTGTAGGCS